MASNEKPRLLFVGGQSLFAESLALMLGADGTWAVRTLPAEDHADLPSVCRTWGPSVVVLDLDSDVILGLAQIDNIQSALPNVGIVVIGESSPALAEAVGRGAAGYLTYDASLEAVREKIEAARAGQTRVTAADLNLLMDGIRNAVPANDPDSPLSPRETEILKRLVAGESTTDIAEALGVRVATARKHIQNILRKLGVHSKLQAAAYAVKTGLV